MIERIINGSANLFLNSTNSTNPDLNSNEASESSYFGLFALIGFIYFLYRENKIHNKRMKERARQPKYQRVTQESDQPASAEVFPNEITGNNDEKNNEDLELGLSGSPSILNQFENQNTGSDHIELTALDKKPTSEKHKVSTPCY